jgi:hypothetical protein
MVCVGGGFAIGISEASRRGLKRALALAILNPEQCFTGHSFTRPLRPAMRQ